ncbi:FtsX-like permease family protein [Streptomyces sp. NBC_00878]|uniref:FtsX-like permease family protein n=1 Tax=Streptomyces sp. NBC_00878 TaxID=2975854 RepID=UPI002252CB27|nr:FtsX-like permease family protein [Streptomyces sp. NBC_00878]MCX4908618.1 FtsX-like permease family protein [Streptomyces sp. NBC_00878]
MWAHRLLLSAALISVVLTTAVLATLAAYSGAIGDAALRHSLVDTTQGAADTESAAATALIVKADVPPRERAAADKAVREGARRTFDGLPVTLRTLTRSGPYALPRSSQPAAARSGDPDLTHFAALDRTQVRMALGRLPRATRSGGSGGDGGEIEVALPEAAARQLALKPGARLTLVDRFDGPKVRILVTGLYRPTQVTSPYWQLDDLRGRGISKVDFTTYGPLLADPSVLAGTSRQKPAVSAGSTGWLASAGFSTLTTGRIDALRDAARTGPRALLKSPSLHGTTAVTTALPEELDRVERSLLVSRSTLLIVALQLALLAGYALLLVARLLSVERAGETRLLRARGGSRRRVAGLAGLEALLLAVPAAVCAPLLAGPLTRLLAGQGALSRLGLRLDTSVADGGVWAVSAGVALGCALAVTVPALTAGSPGSAGGRAPSLPAPVRAGADVGLLVIAAVAYWQLSGQTSGAVTGDLSGTLGIDPLLVSAPALALLAGTVLTLRLLPPVARLAERRAASGRGLPTALAGWQFSRRPMRGAGPVLLLVLAIAMGMLAIGQGASWDRSQDDQADFRAGTSVRVLGSGGEGGLGRAGIYADIDGVRGAAPAVRTTLPLSGNRTATVLALDTADAVGATDAVDSAGGDGDEGAGGGGMLMRGDLAEESAEQVLARLRPEETAPVGTALPKGSTRLGLALRIRAAGVGADESSGSDSVEGSDSGAYRSEMTADVTVTLEDRYGTPYSLPIGELPADGRAHRLTLDLARAAEAPTGRAAEPLSLAGFQLDMRQPSGRAEQHQLSVEELTTTAPDGSERRLREPGSWTVTSRSNSTTVDPKAGNGPTRPRLESTSPLKVSYGTGYIPSEYTWELSTLTLRLRAARPAAPEVTAVATDAFLKAAGARTGQRVSVAFAGSTVTVRIVGSVRALPTTEDSGARAGARSGAGDAAGGGGDGSGGALLVDLRSVNRVLEQRYGESVAPTEWWLRTAPGAEGRVAAELRARPDVEPSQVVVRDEIAERLRDDPFGAGPESAFTAASVVAAALAAVGFAVSTAGSLRERGAEFALLRALGAPRRQLARLVAAEQAVLVALALVVGLALGAVLTRAVIPLIVLTSRATRPVPEVLVQLPPAQVALLLAGVVIAPLIVTAVLALRRGDAVASLRWLRSLHEQGGE